MKHAEGGLPRSGAMSRRRIEVLNADRCSGRWLLFGGPTTGSGGRMRSARRLIAAVVVGGAVLGGLVMTAGPAGALTTITVTSNGDAGGPCTSFPTSCTLRQAFEAADAGGPAQGDDVEFVIQPGVGTISLASTLSYDGGSGQQPRDDDPGQRSNRPGEQHVHPGFQQQRRAADDRPLDVHEGNRRRERGCSRCEWCR